MLLHENKNERGQLVGMTIGHQFDILPEDWTVIGDSSVGRVGKIYRKGRHFR